MISQVVFSRRGRGGGRVARSIAISGHFHIWLISTVHKIVPQDLVDIRLNRKSTKPHSVHAHMNELKRMLFNIILQVHFSFTPKILSLKLTTNGGTYIPYLFAYKPRP